MQRPGVNFAQCTTTIATLGTRVITADYSGDANNDVSSGTLSGGQFVTPPVIAVAPPTLPGGAVGAAYSQTLAASGGTVAYTFALSAGMLPGGLTLSSGGQLSGILTAVGTFNFTIAATDANGFIGATAYAVTINRARPSPSAPPRRCRWAPAR
ncbi:MAG: putative Ig domain-containing protein [Betaproteobacteria bacterium]|nr:putative Ig domain-containing protein [Betaproteobacteria bacterium]